MEGERAMPSPLRFKVLRWHSCGRSRTPDALALVGEIIDDDVVADLIGRGVEHAPGVEPRQLIDEAAAVEVGAEHEGVDLDAALRAAPHFLQRLLHDAL